MAIFNEKTWEIEPNAGESSIIDIPNYKNIRDKSKFTNWICNKSGILKDYAVEEITVEEIIMTPEEKRELTNEKIYWESK